MTDDPAPQPHNAPVIDHEPPPQIPPSETEPRPAPPRAAGPGLSLLALLGVIILAGAVAWLRQNPQPVDLGPLDSRLAAIEQRLGALESRPAARAPDTQPLERRIAALEQREPPAPADLAPLDRRIAALEQRQPPAPTDLKPLDARVAALEQRPAPAPPDLGPLDQRIAALEHQAPPDLKPLDSRVAALEKSEPDLRPLDARIAALEQKPAAPDSTARASVAAAATRLDAIAAREDALGSRQESLEASMSARLDAADARVSEVAKAGGQSAAQTAALVAGLGDKLQAQFGPATDKLAAQVTALDGKLSGQIAGVNDRLGGQIASLNEKLGGQIAGVADKVQADGQRIASAEQGLNTLPGLAERATRMTRLSAAQQALDNGQPLGALDGAPPALAKYAQAKPPTEAQLRLSFPDAARAAAAKSQPAVADKPLLERAWAKAQTLVTVRQGDRVLVGDPSAGVLARARSALDAGDLQGAADAAGSLGGPAADAMAGWLGQARDLLAARAALAALAAQG